MLERRSKQDSAPQERRSSGTDRRVAIRYTAGGTSGTLTWRMGDEYREVDVTLRDISLSGVSMISKDAIPDDVPLWFRVRGDDQSEWVESRVVGISKTGILGRGPRLVRLRFQQPCPYHVFKHAIEGFSQEYQDLEFARGGFRKRDWSTP